MLLADYTVARVGAEVKGIVVLDCLPPQEDFDALTVGLYKLFDRKTVMVTFWSGGRELDSVGFIDLPEDVISAFERGLTVQDRGTMVELQCQISEYEAIPGMPEARIAAT